MTKLALVLALLVVAVPLYAGENWPQFRGPDGNGCADNRGLPRVWSETQNVKWKTPIHDRGWSSPVIWGNQIWLTTATADGKQLFAVCVDRDSGRILRDVKVFNIEKPERINPLNTYASPTPVIEAGRVYVHYGTYGTACLDTTAGTVLWARQDIHCDHEMGPGASPILHEGLLIFCMDGCDVQYIIALDKATGKTVWRTPRSGDYGKVARDQRKAFCTPIIIQANGRPELISPAALGVFAYDPQTGKELWNVVHKGWSLAPRPFFGHGMVFAVTDCSRPALWAIRPGGQGDVSASHVAWKAVRGMPAKPSPLLIGDHIYLVDDKGVACCLAARNGEIVWQHRLGGNFCASPIHADARIYFFSQEGPTTVIEPASTYKELAVNKLDGGFMASPAVAGKELYLRSKTHLYRIEE